MTGHAELVRGRLAERRAELGEHSPRALDLAAIALAAMHEAAHGHVPAIRSDRQVRFRSMQLVGERALPIEDLVAISIEGPVGRAVALAALRRLAGPLGYLLVAEDAGAAEVSEALAGVAESHGTAIAVVARALANDGRVDADEAATIEPHIQSLKSQVASLETAVARAGRGTR